MCHPAADRLSGQAGGNHVSRMPSADLVPLAIPSLLKPMASGRALPGLLVPALAQTVFDAGRRRAISESARANYDAAIATYRQTSNPVGHRAEKSRVLTERYSGGHVRSLGSLL
jgi:hypothetical protein